MKKFKKLIVTLLFSGVIAFSFTACGGGGGGGGGVDDGSEDTSSSSGYAFESPSGKKMVYDIGGWNYTYRFYNGTKNSSTGDIDVMQMTSGNLNNFTGTYSWIKQSSNKVVLYINAETLGGDKYHEQWNLTFKNSYSAVGSMTYSNTLNGRFYTGSKVGIYCEFN